MVYQENFYLYHTARSTAARLRDEMLDLRSSGDTPASRNAEIEYYLTLAHEHYQHRRYVEALREYKTTLGLIYRMVAPTYQPVLTLGDDIRLSTATELIDPMLEVVLEGLARSSDTLPPIVIGPVDPLGTLINPALRDYATLGVETIPNVVDGSEGLIDNIRHGDDFSQLGQFEQAAQSYSRALDGLGAEGSPTVRADLQHNLGLALGELGQMGAATNQLDGAAKAYAQVGDAMSQGIVHENIAALHTRAGSYGAARVALDTAESHYASAARGRAQARAADVGERAGKAAPAVRTHELNNASVRLTQQRNALRAMEQRGSFLGRVSSRIRRGLQAQPSADPQLVFKPVAGGAVARPGASIEDRAELPESIGDEQGSRVLRLATGVEPNPGLRTVSIDLRADNRAAQLRDQVYQHRVAATTLESLGVYVGAGYLADHFRTHIPHHYFFTIQVGLGDVYLKLGQYELAQEHYEKARDYRYLNVAIEAPNIWIRIGECILAWGTELYQNNDIAAAKDKFRQILEVAIDGALTIPAASPLYGHAPLDGVNLDVTAFVAAFDEAEPPPLNPAIEIVLRMARVYQEMIHADLNFLGIPHDIVPIFRFRYLQAVARYFAEQAIKAEREYVNFLNSSEREQANVLQLKQSIAMAHEGVKLEDRRVEEAQLTAQVAEAARALAQERAANALERREEYKTVSADKVALDTATAHASGGFTETTGGYQVHLTTQGETVNLGDEDYEIMRAAAWHRGQILRTFELNDMQRTIDEYNAHVAVTQTQVDLARKRGQVALQNRVIAGLRLLQAQETLDFARNKTLTAELWGNLADRMREFSQLYLERATEIAFLTQAAYNFEMDANLSVISMVYKTGESLGGLLAADTLLSDINYFTYHHITQTKSKEIPLKTIISLSARSPFSIYRFRRTGVLEFETTLEEFDRLYPGTHTRKIQAVEVVMEGLIGADGVNGSLRNLGVSTFRTKDNAVKLRIQPSETLLLSTYSLKGDAVVFRPSDEQLGVFEGSGVSTAWTLAFPRGSNDLDYEAISDVKLVLYYSAHHDPMLEATVRAALPTSGEWSRGFSLRVLYPDAFFLMLEQHEAPFTIEQSDFPYNQEVTTIRRIALQLVPEDGVAADGVQVTIGSGTVAAVTVTTDADGVATSDPGDAANVLNVFHGTSPLDAWNVALDPEANPTLFVEEPVGSGIMRLRGIRDIVVVVDYLYDVRE